MPLLFLGANQEVEEDDVSREREPTLSGTSFPNANPLTGRDVFRDGPSPELQEFWDKLEKLENIFWRASPAERERLLREEPEIRHLVLCEECGQILPENQGE